MLSILSTVCRIILINVRAIEPILASVLPVSPQPISRCEIQRYNRCVLIEGPVASARMHDCVLSGNPVL